jgi:splicing factor U2AF subunit
MTPRLILLCRSVLQDDLCSFFNALMTCSGAQLDSGNSVISCSITRDKGPPYAFIKLRSVQEASNALAFNGIQFRGHTLKVRRHYTLAGMV